LNTDKVTAAEAAQLMAFGADAAKTTRLTHLIRTWTQAGILSPVGRGPGGQKAPFLYERSVAAVATIMLWLRDRAGVTDHRHLIGLATMLSTARPGADMALIDAILTEIERDGDEPPVLLLTVWGNPAGEFATSFVVVLAGEYENEIAGPGPEWAPVFDGVVSLAPLLSAFVERVIVPFRQREAT
jgi:hypothetical protein